MSTTLKRLLGVASISAILVFGLLVINQTAQIVELAARVNSTFGDAVFWALIFTYAGLVAVPVVLLVRLPEPLRPPDPEDHEAVAEHVKELGERLKRNPLLADHQLSTREDLQEALDVVDQRADEIIKARGSGVFLATAASQNGSLDALVVLYAQSRLVWQIARLYYQRPALRELGYLYANVAGTAFLAAEIEDVDLSEQVAPIVSNVVGSAVGAVPGLQAASTVLVSSLMSGTSNALLTLRVGFLAKEYCRSLVKPKRSALRAAATMQATIALGGITAGGARRVAAAIMTASKKSAGGAVRGVGATFKRTGESIRDAGSSALDKITWWGDEEEGLEPEGG